MNMKDFDNDKFTAEYLIAIGYRRVSRKHRIIARVDRPDWKIAGRQDSPHTASGFPSADYYRRCITKDSMVVADSVFSKIPSSDHDPIGYVDKDTMEERNELDKEDSYALLQVAIQHLRVLSIEGLVDRAGAIKEAKVFLKDFDNS